jgi:SAM-dependent methyltransferase
MADQIQKVEKPMRSCPACSTKEATFYTEKNGFVIFKCSHCKSLYVSEPPKSTASIYGEKYFWGAESGFGYVDYDADKEPMRAVFEKCIMKAEEIAGKKGRLVDIGAATGYFIKLAKSMGWSVEGVEIGDSAAEAGRKAGLKMLTGTIAELPLSNKFDAITMFDVIEHVENPLADLKKAHELLNPGGALVIITPNSGSIYARMLGKRWHHFVPPEHLTLFTESGLREVLTKAGFEVISVSVPGKLFTLEYILHTLLRWQELKIWQLCLDFVKKMPFIANLRLPANTRDNMLVYARRA